MALCSAGRERYVARPPEIRLSLVASGMSHVRESRLLCRKMVETIRTTSNTQDKGARRLGMTQELLKLVTGIAHYLKILIRIALTGALKLGREHGIDEAMQSFLDKLHRLAVESGNPSARRMIAGGDDLPLARRFASINTSTYGVTYGFRSLAPEIAGESPFLDVPRDFALATSMSRALRVTHVSHVPSPSRKTACALARTNVGIRTVFDAKSVGKMQPLSQQRMPRTKPWSRQGEELEMEVWLRLRGGPQQTWTSLSTGPRSPSEMLDRPVRRQSSTAQTICTRALVEVFRRCRASSSMRFC
jgi:hypothetical protein